ncbi:EthD domain-containing protein [Hyphomonas sp.]|uniref:EthD domain-containing protein n=1 Tax=Hyphomonas sp. TaxID=87 RepID=UPI0025BB9663|nr:EthD domain-containing protein [Hyphomonas sp.]MBI1401337.1 EthD family reductase [Hyphomonas sp.]
MIKLNFYFRRLPQRSQEEFQRYWREDHAPLVAKHASALGSLRYVQAHTGHGSLNGAMQASRGGPDAYDVVAELWFESDATMAANTSEAAARASAELLADATNFIDLANSPLSFSNEHVIVG